MADTTNHVFSMDELEARYLELAERLNSLEKEKQEEAVRRDEGYRARLRQERGHVIRDGFAVRWDLHYIKRKLFMATVMLLTSAILTGMSTYAWFILSTAPELSGLAATANANGSLEIALLNNETGGDLNRVTAKIGDSSSIVGRAASNITWGNIVDLGDDSYGLNKLILDPAVANYSEGTSKLNVSSILSVPQNGTDGRIKSVGGNTKSAVFKNGTFVADGTKYGVRAIGSSGGSAGDINGSRGSALEAAKSAFSANLNGSKTMVQSVLLTQGSSLAAVALQGESGEYSYSDVLSARGLITGCREALNMILSSYRYLILITAAADKNVSDSDFQTIRSGVFSASGNAFSNYVNYLPSGVSISDLNRLNEQIAAADRAASMIDGLINSADAAEKTYTYSQFESAMSVIAGPVGNIPISGTTLELSTGRTPGILTEIAEQAGNYTISMSGYSLSVSNSGGSSAGVLGSVDTSKYTYTDTQAATTETNTTVDAPTISKFYGYAVDLGFRTNVNTALQLQIAAVNRIYADGAMGTMGGGSTITYTAGESKMTEKQVKTLFSAIRVVFFDPDSGVIYTTATAGEPTSNGEKYTSMLTPSGAAKITDLTAATPKKVSVLFYLDGTMLDNMSVANAKNSGSVQMNLQFSSSELLSPIVDDEIKNKQTADTPAGSNTTQTTESTQTTEDEG